MLWSNSKCFGSGVKEGGPLDPQAWTFWMAPRPPGTLGLFFCAPKAGAQAVALCFCLHPSLTLKGWDPAPDPVARAPRSELERSGRERRAEYGAMVENFAATQVGSLVGTCDALP